MVSGAPQGRQEGGLRLGWFSTGRGEGSRRLLTAVQDRILRGDLPAAIQFAFCNREPGEAEGSDQFQALVRSFGLPLVAFSSRRFRRERGARTFDDVREAYDQEVLQRLGGFSPDLCTLAGYMLYAGPALCRRYAMINLHPALPQGPVGTWQEVVWQLIEGRARETGAMIHLATEEWDRGPVITYFTLPLVGPEFDPLWRQVGQRSVAELKATYGEDLPLFQRIRREELKRELPLVVETIRAFALGQVRVVGRQVVDVQGRPLSGYCLNEQVEAALRQGDVD